MNDRRLWHLVPEFLWSGISLAIYVGLIVPMIVMTLPNDDANTQFMKSLLPMFAFGVGEVSSGLVLGQIIDRKILSQRGVCVFILFLIIIETVLVCIFIAKWEYGTITYLMTFFWGFQDGTVNTHIQ